MGVPAPCAGIHHGTPSGNRAHLHKPDSQRSQAIGQSGGVAGGESDHYPQAEWSPQVSRDGLHTYHEVIIQDVLAASLGILFPELRWFVLQEGPRGRGWTSLQSPSEWTQILQTSTGTVSAKPPVGQWQHTLTTAKWSQLRLQRQRRGQDLPGGAVIRHRVVQPQAQRPEWVHGTGGHVFVGLQPTCKKTYFFYWSAVDLQCYISFRCEAKWLRFSSIVDYYKMLSRAHCAIQ